MVANSIERQPLGQLLLNRGIVSQEALNLALEEQKRLNHQKLLGEVLVDLNICTEDQIVESLAAAYGVPYARITPRVADPRAIAEIPREVLEKHQILPLFLVEGVLTVALPEPADVFLIEEIARLTGHKIQIVAATARDIKATLQAYLPNESVFVIDDIIDEANLQNMTLIEEPSQDLGDLASAADESPVIKLVNYCLYNAIKEQASDIHIEPGDRTLRIRFRVDGRLIERLRPPFLMHPALVSRIKIMSSLDISQRRLPQDGAIHVMMDKRPIDIRVATLPGKWGEKVVLRVIDNDKAAVNLERLGFSYESLKHWRKLIQIPNGILLVTGPTGSGKSTTLYASLAELNSPEVNICTVEDPIEYAMTGVNQFQVNDKIQFSFANALRALLRQDPDIIMVGEIRDGDTARIATQAALTGHLVLSTLHTNDAPSSITRLFNLEIEPYLVGATLSGILAQRLVRKLCQACREPYEPTPNEIRALEKTPGKVEVLYRAKGCARCHNRGYTGRIGVHELLVPNDVMVERISAGASLNELKDHALKSGLVPLRADGIDKVKAGLTTLEEVHRVTA